MSELKQGSSALSQRQSTATSDNSKASESSLDSRSTIAKRGWLMKWTNVMKGYKKRWFVLQDRKLTYSISSDQDAEIRGEADLTSLHIQVERGSSRNFLLLDQAPNGAGSGAVFAHLRCKTEKERVEWITSLEFAKNPDPPAWSTSDDRTSLNGSEHNSRANTPNPILDLENFSSDDDSDAALDSTTDSMYGSAVLNRKLKRILECHQQLHKQSEALALKISFVAPLSDELESTAEDAELFSEESGQLLDCSSDFMNAAITFQTKWAKLLQRTEKQCQHIEAQAIASRNDLDKLSSSINHAKTASEQQVPL